MITSRKLVAALTLLVSANIYSANQDGLRFALEDPSPVFYLDTTDMPSNTNVAYQESVYLSIAAEINSKLRDSAVNQKNGTALLTVSYGGIKDGACKGILESKLNDNDTDVICFVKNYARDSVDGRPATGDTHKTYLNGITHEKSFVVIDPDWNGIGHYLLYRTIAFHELLHALGLGHVSKEFLTSIGEMDSSIMISEEIVVGQGLSAYDVKQLNFLYSAVEPHPEYPRHCTQKVRDDEHDKGDLYFPRLNYQGTAFWLKTKLNLEKMRFDIVLYGPAFSATDTDCMQLELVNMQVRVPYTFFENYAVDLRLELVEDSEGIYFNIIGACIVFPFLEEHCEV